MTETYEPDLEAPTRILRLSEVLARTGLARSTIYLRIAQGSFPKPISLGPRAVGWIEAEVDVWLRQRIEASRREPEGWCSPPAGADRARSGSHRGNGN